MLKFSLMKETAEEVVYKYHPEGSPDFGIISYDRKAKKCNVTTPSKKDKRLKYAQKMFARIRECASNDLFQKEGVIAWG